MNVEVLKTADAVAQRGADIIAAEARESVGSHGRFVMGLSGGRTPWQMLQVLATRTIPWTAVHVVQIDERIAPADHPDRNATHLREILLAHTTLPVEQIHEMPVEAAELESAAVQYETILRRVAGSPPVLDLVHLGLGGDGHTASLLPEDPVLNVTSADVALTTPYQGWRRMTLTYPIINRSRKILWVITGSEKASMLKRFLNGDRSIPAARVRREQALVIADDAAAAYLGANIKNAG